MKAKLMTAICVTIVLGSGAPCLAEENTGPLAMAADVVLVRPACILATVVGSTIFVLGLPFSLPSKSVRKTAHALVVTPARAAFTRQVGDMEALQEDNYDDFF